VFFSTKLTLLRHAERVRNNMAGFRTLYMTLSIVNCFVASQSKISLKKIKNPFSSLKKIVYLHFK